MNSSPKSHVFNYLSKSQKADLVRYFTQLANKLEPSQVEETVESWLEEESFLCQQGTSYKPWLAEYLDDAQLAKDARRFLAFQVRYKASQRISQEAKDKLKAGQKARKEAMKLAQWEKLPATPKQKGAVRAIVKLAGKEVDLSRLTKAQAYSLIKKKKEAESKLHWKEPPEKREE